MTFGKWIIYPLNCFLEGSGGTRYPHNNGYVAILLFYKTSRTILVFLYIDIFNFIFWD